MQTLQFTRALKRIVSEMKADELSQILTQVLSKDQNRNITLDLRNQFSTLLFESRVGFYELSKDSVAHRVLDALGINELYSPPHLGHLLTLFSSLPNSQGIWGNSENFYNFLTFAGMLGWLRKLSAACSMLLDAERTTKTDPNSEIVELELVDFDGMGIEAGRVRQFFDGLEKLHLNLALALGIQDAHIKILYFDSGSTLLIGAQVTKAIAETIVRLFKQFWEKIKYQRFEDFDRKVESLSNGLDFTAKVQEQIDNKVIDEETGTKLKYRVLSEMTTLIGIGAILPADDAAEKVDQRKLLAEKKGVRLLGSGSPVDK